MANGVAKSMCTKGPGVGIDSLPFTRVQVKGCFCASICQAQQTSLSHTFDLRAYALNVCVYVCVMSAMVEKMMKGEALRHQMDHLKFFRAPREVRSLRRRSPLLALRRTSGGTWKHKQWPRIQTKARIYISRRKKAEPDGMQGSAASIKTQTILRDPA